MFHSGRVFFLSHALLVDTVAAGWVDGCQWVTLAAEMQAGSGKDTVRWQEKTEMPREEEFIKAQAGQIFSYCNGGYGLLSILLPSPFGSASCADYLLEHAI